MKICISVFILIAGGIGIAGCSSSTQLASKWAATPVVANGRDDEWGGAIMYQEKEKIGVGIMNDGTNVYVVVKTLDEPTLRKIVRTGMTIWLDSTGNSKKNFGIHFPLGATEMLRGGGYQTDEGAGDGSNTRQYRERLAETLREIEVIGPGPLDKKRMPVSSSLASNGIKVGISDSLDMLVYELMIPMRSTIGTPLAIGTDIGRTISVGVETADPREIRRAIAGNDMGGGMGGGMRPGGMGGFGGGGMRGSRGGRMTNTNENTEPIKLWFDVTLAKP